MYELTAVITGYANSSQTSPVHRGGVDMKSHPWPRSYWKQRAAREGESVKFKSVVPGKSALIQ